MRLSHSLTKSYMYLSHDLQARREKEVQSIKTLKSHISRIHSLKDFHTFFHTEHKAYNVESQDVFGRGSVAVGDPDSLY